MKMVWFLLLISKRYYYIFLEHVMYVKWNGQPNATLNVK